MSYFKTPMGTFQLKIKIYKTIILPVVLYGCETWSLTLSEERILSYLKKKEKKVPEANIWTKERCEWGVEKASQ